MLGWGTVNAGLGVTWVGIPHSAWAFGEGLGLDLAVAPSFPHDAQPGALRRVWCVSKGMGAVR